MHTHVFQRLCKATALSIGYAAPRQAYVPQPVVDRSAADLRGYIEGQDPVSKQPFMQEVLSGLLSPLDEADLQGLTFERTTPRLVESDTEDNLQRLFEENHWTDMLPIVLPTEARVEAMLEGTSHAADTIVGRLRPTAFREFWEFTVEKVAANAVMAGARPEYFPVLSRRLARHLYEMGNPIRSARSPRQRPDPQRDRNELGDRRDGAVPTHANATIGRAFGLLSRIFQGGSVPDDTYMGSLGNWYCVTAVLPEAEERSPWEPLHVQKGFKPTDSVASIFFGGWYRACRLRSAGHVAGEDAPLSRRGRAVRQPAAVRDGSDRGARIRRPRLRHEGKADRLVRRQCAHDGAPLWDNQWIRTSCGRARWPASSSLRRVSKPNRTR